MTVYPDYKLKFIRKDTAKRAESKAEYSSQYIISLLEALHIQVPVSVTGGSDIKKAHLLCEVSFGVFSERFFPQVNVS